jgi:PAS domain S-box-containing protein
MTHDAEKQLLEMAARLAGVGHWRFEVASGRITWSPETYRIHGLPQTENEPDYDHLLGLYLPESADLLSSLVERALATGQGYSLEASLRRPDGAIRYVAAKAECVLDANGNVEALIGVFQDVTERTQAERFMRVLTNYIPAMVAYWDINLRCSYANEQYREWFGRTPGEMLGISMRELMGAELFARNEPFIRGAMSGQAQSFERTLIKPSGETGHTLARYIPDVNETGGVRGMVAVVTDVTEIKEAALKLEEANAVTGEALALSQAALSVKSEFLSNISHELRNPLTAIVGFSELLGDNHILSGEDGRYLDRIRAASTDLLTTVNDLLDFSKLEAGHVSIEREPADPYTVGLHALDFFEPQLSGKNLSYAFEAHDLPPSVMMDRVRVRQVLLNFIGNAAKFTTRGSVTLIAEYDASRGVLRYVVADTGPGIPEEHQAKLFQRFSQVDGARNRKTGGTGLGLAICKGIAEAMGGRVGFVTVAGEGSRFWLEAPCESVFVKGEGSSSSGELADPATVLRGLRLLVVDDHPVNRELVKRMVEPLGVAVAEAECGRDGVALASAEQFDIILLDVVMPEMDGPTTSLMIRSGAGPNRSAAIIAFTANGDRNVRPEWADLFSDQLPKPFSASDLINLLMRHSSAQAH